MSKLQKDKTMTSELVRAVGHRRFNDRRDPDRERMVTALEEVIEKYLPAKHHQLLEQIAGEAADAVIEATSVAKADDAAISVIDVANDQTAGEARGRALEQTQAEAARWFGEVMAVMHADGGHYLAKHGPEKAANDAVDKYHGLWTRIHQLEAARSVTDAAGLDAAIHRAAMGDHAGAAKALLEWAEAAQKG